MVRLGERMVVIDMCCGELLSWGNVKLQKAEADGLRAALFISCFLAGCLFGVLFS